MILFYSDLCPYCRTLLDEIKRKDSQKVIKLVSIDWLRANNRQVPKQIHSVPALVLNTNNSTGRDVVFGRKVFDMLFLPNTGILTRPSVQTMSATATSTTTTANDERGQEHQMSNGPEPFVLDSSMSSTFSAIDDTATMTNSSIMDVRSFAYSQINEPSGLELDRQQASLMNTYTTDDIIKKQSNGPNGPGQAGSMLGFVGEETRSKNTQNAPSLDDLLAARASDLQNVQVAQPQQQPI